MNTKTCPHCDREIAVRCLSQHVKSCAKMPDPKTFARVAPTLTVTEMVAAWGVTKSSIWSRLNRTGVRAKIYCRYAPPTDEQRAQIFSLYDQNASLQAIADNLEISIRKADSTVRKAIRTGELVRRKRIYNLAAKYKRCGGCGIRLDRAPTGHGVLCGFCTGGTPVAEIVREGDMGGLADNLLDAAVRDATNKQYLHRSQVREWLSSGMADWWIDATGVDFDFARDQIKRALGGQRVIRGNGDRFLGRGSAGGISRHRKNEGPKSGGRRAP